MMLTRLRVQTKARLAWDRLTLHFPGVDADGFLAVEGLNNQVGREHPHLAVVSTVTGPIELIAD